MPAKDNHDLRTVRDLVRYAVSNFNRAGLAFGHGTGNAWDEAVYLVLHSLHLPLDRLEPFLDAALSPTEIASFEVSTIAMYSNTGATSYKMNC